TSVAPFVYKKARLLAALSNATNWPLEETAGKLQLPFAPIPRDVALTSVVRWFARSRRNTARYGPRLSLVTRFLAWLTKATNWPSGLKLGLKEFPAPETTGRPGAVTG